MNKIDALKILGYKYITKNKYSKHTPYEYVTAWMYKPILCSEDDLRKCETQEELEFYACGDELIRWSNGCEPEDLYHWTQTHVKNCSDFDCISEDATEPYEIE